MEGIKLNTDMVLPAGNAEANALQGENAGQDAELFKLLLQEQTAQPKNTTKSQDSTFALQALMNGDEKPATGEELKMSVDQMIGKKASFGNILNQKESIQQNVEMSDLTSKLEAPSFVSQGSSESSQFVHQNIDGVEKSLNLGQKEVIVNNNGEKVVLSERVFDNGEIAGKETTLRLPKNLINQSGEEFAKLSSTSDSLKAGLRIGNSQEATSNPELRKMLLESKGKKSLFGNKSELYGKTTQTKNINATELPIGNKQSNLVNMYKTDESQFLKGKMLENVAQENVGKSFGSNKVVSSPEFANQQSETSKFDLFINNSPVQTAEIDAGATQAVTKTLNLSNIDTANTEELINKISDYIEQSSLANEKSVDLAVRHNTLGKFNINASKMAGNNQIDLTIAAGNEEGHKFFVQNESQLLRNLGQAGLKIADVKILLTNTESNSSNMSGDNKSSSNGESNNFGRGGQQSDRGSENADSRRRRDLWEMFNQKDVA